MKKRERNALLGSSFGAILMAVAGLILLIHPDFGSTAVAVIIGWGLVVVGALGILVSVFSWPIFGPLEVIVCILGLGVGIYLLRSPLSLASILGLGLGVWLVIQGCSAFRDAWKLKKAGWGYAPNAVLALLMVALGLVFFFSPLTTSRIIMSLCGLAMLICSVGKLILRARAAKLLQEYDRKRKIIDADE